MYQVSDYGQIYNQVYHRSVQTSRRARDGHAKVSLIADSGIRHTVSVAYLVADAFVERPYDDEVEPMLNRYQICDHVVYLDGDIMNVAAYNLAWRPYRFAWVYARQMRTPPPPHYTRLRIRNNETGAEYNSIYDAGMTEGVLFEDVWKSLHESVRVFPLGHTYSIIERR